MSVRSIETPQTAIKPHQTAIKPPQTTLVQPPWIYNIPSTPHLPLTLSPDQDNHNLYIPPLFRFMQAILSLMCCLVLSNNLQSFEVINYNITLPLRGHGSIISQILIGLGAPRLNSIKCLVSLQYEQYGETFNTYLV